MNRLLACALLGSAMLSAVGVARSADVMSDTWVATDGLGRTLPTHADTGSPRPDRTVGLFYFLWHGAHIQGGPYDVTRILREDPAAMQKPDSPLWGPLHVPHHWGESLFGYYLTDDEGVLRKHAQMLGDAGVDVVIFDVTNQLSYPEWYRALLKVWGECRAAGNRTPAVAFLTPFWDPAKVTRELWHDLYEPGRSTDLWFRWEGKPLLLADPDLLEVRVEQAKQNTPVELEPGATLGQSFETDRPMRAVGGRFPTWGATGAAVTLTLWRDRPGGERLFSERFHDVADNAWLQLKLPSPLPPGRYYLEASEPGGRIGWWSHDQDLWPNASAFARGNESAGDRTLRWIVDDPETERIRQFFTFRKPQPDYFRGPTRADMWSWLEVYPQHVFTNAAGQKEQMSVGVAQNAVNGRLGSMSEAGALGRSYHGGRTDPRPDAVQWGFNLAEQWERARRVDPRFVFVTGWNEWIAGRFAEFNRVREPVMFVDQFDQEHSRDIEPMRGGHGDHYYWQLVGEIRRYKGVRPIPTVRSAPVRIDGERADWDAVEPEFRDTVGDPMRRDHRGWNPQVRNQDATGRNDLVAAKVSASADAVQFMARTSAELTPPPGTNWMVLFLDIDADVRTGWLGYDFVVNRTGPGVLERHAGGGCVWEKVREVPLRAGKDFVELEIPWDALRRKESAGARPPVIDFKWADNCLSVGDWTDFTLHGDAAPNDRFNYRARFESP